MKNNLYEFTMKVSRGEGCELPKGMSRAYVNCYASAPDHKAAIKKGVIAITQDHYIFEEIVKDIREIPIDRWNEYIEKSWSGFTDYFPNSKQVETCVKEGLVFFSPFMGFNN